MSPEARSSTSGRSTSKSTAGAKGRKASGPASSGSGSPGSGSQGSGSQGSGSQGSKGPAKAQEKAPEKSQAKSAPARSQEKPQSKTQDGRPQNDKAQDGKPQGSKPKASGRPSTKGLVRPAPRAKVRRARLVVSKIDTWSVLKLSFLLSVALGIITLVVAVLLWILMDLTGLFDGINELTGMLAGPEGSPDIRDVISLGQVAIMATVLSVINVILLTLASVLATVLYNLASGLVGGIGVTLTDD